MKSERLFYLDFIRAVAAVSIVLTHFNARYLMLNPPMPEKAVITASVGGIYIGNWGVSLFFIISGAALMYVYGERCELKKFYKKRFLSLYPMFWIAYILAFFLLFYIDKAAVGGGASNWRIIFSILGCDGLLLANGVSVFYILGEWFLGVIILMYLLFPLLRRLLNAKPYLTVFLAAALYAATLVFCHFGPPQIQSQTIVFTRIPEFLFGMCFVKYNWKVGKKTALAALVVFVLNTVFQPALLLDIQTTYVGIASFLILVYISYFAKSRLIQKVCGLISKYSYAVFLVHHLIISRMMPTFNLAEISVLHSYLLFGSVCCVIAACTWLLYEIHRRVMDFLKA